MRGHPAPRLRPMLTHRSCHQEERQSCTFLPSRSQSPDRGIGTPTKTVISNSNCGNAQRASKICSSFDTTVGARAEQWNPFRKSVGKQIENAGNRLTEPIRRRERIAKHKSQRECRTHHQQYTSRPSSLLLHCYHQKSKSSRKSLHLAKRS